MQVGGTEKGDNHGLIYKQIKGHRKGAFRSRSSGRSGAQEKGISWVDLSADKGAQKGGI